MPRQTRNTMIPPGCRPAVAAIAAVLLCSGCAGLTAQQAEDREYRRVVYKHQFLAFRERCRAGGGRIVIQANARVGSDMMPRPGDRYSCL